MDQAEYRSRIATLRSRYAWLIEHDRMISFDVEPGWLGLVERLFAEIDRAVPHDQQWRFRCAQLKEKVGALRFYFDLMAPDVDVIMPKGVARFTAASADQAEDPLHLVRRIAREAEAASASRCQFCGDAGRARNHGGLIITQCVRHAAFDFNDLMSAFDFLTTPASGAVGSAPSEGPNDFSEHEPTTFPEDVLAAAIAVWGREEEVERWMHNKNMFLRGSKPVELLATAEGRKRIRTLLTQLKFGSPPEGGQAR